MKIKLKHWKMRLINCKKSGERMAEIYYNDIANLFKDREPLRKQLQEINRELGNLKDEYNLYYK